MSRKLHVLVLPSWYPTPWSPQRGIFFREQVRALDRAGLSVGVAYPELRRFRGGSEGWWRQRFQVSLEEEDGVPTARVHGWNVPSARLRGLLFRTLAHRAVARYVDARGRPDLVHAHSALWAGTAARRIREDLGVPYVLTEHSSAFGRGLLAPWQLERVREACAGAEEVLAVSRAVGDELCLQAGVSEVSVVPNMVDTDYFALPPEPRTSPPFTFLTVATLRPNKRVDVLLRAFDAAFLGEEKVRLTIGGDGRSRPGLHQLSRDLGIEDRVRFPGRLTREEVRGAMWRANAYVLSSDVETFGVALVEAMSTGLPVVATRCGGPEEIVTEETGWLVPPNDPGALAGALEAAREAGTRSRSAELRIRRQVVERYGEAAVTSRIRGVYRSVQHLEST